MSADPTKLIACLAALDENRRLSVNLVEGLARAEAQVKVLRERLNRSAELNVQARAERDAAEAQRDTLVEAVRSFLSYPGLAGRRQNIDSALAAIEPPEEQA